MRTTTGEGGGGAFSPTHAVKARQDTKAMPMNARTANTPGLISPDASASMGQHLAEAPGEDPKPRTGGQTIGRKLHEGSWGFRRPR